MTSFLVAGFLVLWDIDFTLVDTSGAGRELYERAFAELYDRTLPSAAAEADMAGRTDRAIVLDVLALAGVPDPRGQVSLFHATMAKLAPSLTDLVAATGKVLPGAETALAALAQHDHGMPVRQSVLTGNIRAMAAVKLAPLGLATHLDLDVGAYGDEHEVRAELVHLARERAAAAYGRDFGGQATILVGDTPLDVEAALLTGARAVGVASGRFTASELVDAGAHTVLADLTDTPDVVCAVLGR